jgi:hypothetical protein
VVIEYLDDLLRWRNALDHLAANRTFADCGYEVARHTEVYVCFEQGHPNFTQGCVHIRFAEPATTSKLAKYTVEPLGQNLKHDQSGMGGR